MGQLEIPICASTGQFAPDFCTRNGPEFEGLNIGAKFVIFALAGDGGLLGREPINLPAGRLARVRYAPDSRRIIAKQRNDALGQFQTSSTLLPFDATFIPSFWMDATESCAGSSAGRWHGKPRTLLQTFAQAWALRTPRRISGRRARTARRRR